MCSMTDGFVFFFSSFFNDNFILLSKSQIIMSRVGGFSNGCKSPAQVIKDADINIWMCRLIPSAQLWGRGSVTRVRLAQCAVCAGSSKGLICFSHRVQTVGAWLCPWWAGEVLFSHHCIQCVGCLTGSEGANVWLFTVYIISVSRLHPFLNPRAFQREMRKHNNMKSVST